MNDIHPILKQKIDRLFEIARIPYNYDLRITSGYRSPEEQQALYEQGRTKPGSIVTNARGLPICESDHCKGLAVDVVDRKNGYNINWKLLGQLARSVGLKWGGDWAQFPDKPHFYIDNPIINDPMRTDKHDYILRARTSGKFAFAKAGTGKKQLLDREDFGLALMTFLDRLNAGEFAQDYIVNVDDKEWYEYEEVAKGTWI
jgi:peptidoglycan L-alanyl-D-glutamate endopeptidase CwlK